MRIEQKIRNLGTVELSCHSLRDGKIGWPHTTTTGYVDCVKIRICEWVSGNERGLDTGSPELNYCTAQGRRIALNVVAT